MHQPNRPATSVSCSPVFRCLLLDRYIIKYGSILMYTRTHQPCFVVIHDKPTHIWLGGGGKWYTTWPPCDLESRYGHSRLSARHIRFPTAQYKISVGHVPDLEVSTRQNCMGGSRPRRYRWGGHLILSLKQGCSVCLQKQKSSTINLLGGNKRRRIRNPPKAVPSSTAVLWLSWLFLQYYSRKEYITILKPSFLHLHTCKTAFKLSRLLLTLMLLPKATTYKCDKWTWAQKR